MGIVRKIARKKVVNMSKIVVEMTTDEAKALRGMQRVIDKQIGVEQGAKKIGRASDQAGKKVNDGFGMSAAAKLATFAGGFLSVSSAVNVVQQALSGLVSEADEAGRSLENVADKQRLLRQTAMGSKEKLDMQVKMVSLLRNVGYTPEEAISTIFSGASSDYSQFVNPDQIPTYKDLKKVNAPADVAIQSAQIFQENYSNFDAGIGSVSKGAGSFRQINNKLLRGSADSPVPYQEFAGALSPSAMPAAKLGLPDEFLIAIGSEVTKTTDKPMRALESVKSLLQQLNKKIEDKRIDLPGIENIRGEAAYDLLISLRELADQGKLLNESGKESVSLSKFIGEVNAIQGLDLIINAKDNIRKKAHESARIESETGTAKDYLTKISSVSTTSMDIEQGSKEQSQKLKQTQEKVFGDAASLVNTMLNRSASDRLSSGTPKILYKLSGMFDEFTRYMAGDDYRYLQYNTIDQDEEFARLRRTLLDEKDLPGFSYMGTADSRQVNLQKREVLKYGPSPYSLARHSNYLSDADRQIFMAHRPALKTQTEVTKAMQEVSSKPVAQRFSVLDEMRKRDANLGYAPIRNDLYERLERTSSQQEFVSAIREFVDFAKSERARISEGGIGVGGNTKSLTSLIESLNQAASNLKAVTSDAKRNKIAVNRSAALQQGR